MKCKNWSNKINNFVVRKLKSFKINGQQKVTSTTTMPTIPKEIKKSTLSINENKFNDYDDNNIIKMKQHHHNNQQDQQKLQFKQKSTSIIHNNKKHSIDTTKKSSSLSQTKITPAIEATAQSFMMITNDKNYDENNDKKNNTTTSTSSITTSSFLNENLLAKLSLTVQDIYDDLKSSEASNNTLTANKMSVDDFIFGRNCGEGSFSTVYHAKDIHTNKEYAIKVCDKQHILRERKQEYVRREREAMQIMQNTPGFVNLSGTFQDYQNLYFIMTYAKNGDLLPYIQKVGSFDLDCARYYSAELLISIEQMHKKGIIHRDLKPENILLDKDMHTLITDFGSVKILGSDRNNSCSMSEISPNRRRRCSFVGTAQYVSPEVLLGQDVTRAADLWALGCIIYQMLTGLYPFRGDNEYLIFKEILNLNLEFPDGFDRDAADLIRSLLKLNPEERIGFQDKIGRYESIRTHPFFDEINWDVVRKQTPPQICSCVVDLHKHDDDDDCNDDAILCSR